MALPISKLTLLARSSPVSSATSRNAFDKMALNKLGAHTNSSLQLASPSPSLNVAADTSLWSCSRHRSGFQLLEAAQESQRGESSHPVSHGCTTNARPSRKRCSVK